jgi:peptidoglycan/LPS O-acetylase OafA/YrhL
VNDYISKIPILNKILEFLGKHSINIFLIHSFIRAIYGKDLIYKLPNFIVTIVVLLLISLVLSIIIEQMKKLFKYDRLVDKLIYKIRNSALN